MKQIYLYIYSSPNDTENDFYTQVYDASDFAPDYGFLIIILFFSIGSFVRCISIFLFLTKQILDLLSMGLVDCHYVQI